MSRRRSRRRCRAEIAHAEQLELVGAVRRHYPELFKGTRVVEIGPLDGNGSIRQLFERCDTVSRLVEPFPSLFMRAKGRRCDFYVVGTKGAVDRTFGALAAQLELWLAAQNAGPRSLLKRVAFMALGQTGVDVCRRVEHLARWRPAAS